MRIKSSVITIIFIAGFIIAASSQFISAVDAPHNASNNIYCGSCHGEALFDSPFWGGSYDPANIDDTAYNKLCLSCHTAPSGPYTEISAPFSRTHSSLTTNNKYGEWTTECLVCHNPHYQSQKNHKTTDAGKLYLATGTFTSCVYNGDGTSTLTYSTIIYRPGWDATKLTKKTEKGGNDKRSTILFPNIGKLGYSYPIKAVDDPVNTITVKGDARPVYQYTSSSTFAVIYGQYIRDIIDVDGTSKTVKFFDDEGENSFADGDWTYDGICEVCHTKTDHFRNDGGASDQDHGNLGDKDGTNCITACHSHMGGLKGESAGRTACQDCHSDLQGYMNGTMGYHHYMNNVGVTYANISQPVNMGNTSDANRNCLMCHVDHDIFRPDINLSATRTKSLRASISVTPSAGNTNTYANTDFNNAQVEGGICVSCHATAQTKSYTQPDNTTKTLVVEKANFTQSAHDYATTSTFGQDSSTFNANCSKCHNDTLNPKSNLSSQSSTNKFGNHQSSLRSITATLGITSPTDPLEEKFCYRCHSKTADTNPGGGPAKTNAGKDYYGVGNMLTAGSEDIYTVFGKTYKHNVAGYSGVHKASPTDETSTYLSANKHVECNDCHNPHAAKAGLHSSNKVHVAARTNLISASGPLTGALGVQPTWSSSNWGGASSWPSTSTTSTKEHQICFKCHADYNTNPSGWNSANINWTTTTGTSAWTNVALEFNPKNNSYHPVVQALPEQDPSYLYDPGPPAYVSDAADSNQLPPAFTSLVIGDSGFSGKVSPSINDATKNWQTNGWTDWGVRVGTMSKNGNSAFNQVGAIKTNNANSLTSVQWQSMLGFSPGVYDSDVVYSIEYYAGIGTRNGLTVTDGNYGGTKDFTRYLPSLSGYVVVITDTAGNNVAKGTVDFNDATSFTVTVDAWTIVKGASAPSGTVGYYFSATGHTMMCSDCHSNDTISQTAAQGPHGSAVKWMLKGRNKAWPTLAKSDNGSGTGTLRKIGYAGTTPNHRSLYDGTDNGLFCLNCHSTVSFSKNKYGLQDAANVHVVHAASWPEGPECVRCHILVPHGGKLSRLIGSQNSTMPARYAFANDLSNMWVTRYWKATDPAGYAKTTGRGNDWCSVYCHDTNPYHHPFDGKGDNW